MPVDRTYRIRITTEADASGAVAAGKALEGLGQTAQETKEHTLKLGEAHREMHKLMHLASEEAPILGVAMRSAFSPIGAALMGAIAVFRYFNSTIEESKKKAEELAESFSRSIGDMRSALEEARAQVAMNKQEYEAYVVSTQTHNDALMASYQAQIEGLEQERKTVEEVGKAELERVRHRVETDQTLSPEKRERELAALEARGKAFERSTVAVGIREEITATAAAQSLAREQKDIFASDQTAAEGRRENVQREALIKDLPARIAAIEEMVKTQKGIAGEAEAKLASTQERANRNVIARQAAGLGASGEGRQKDLADLAKAEQAASEANDRWRKTEAEMAKNKEALATAEREAKADEAAVERAKESFKSASEAVDKLAEKLESLNRQLTQANQVSAAQAGAANAALFKQLSGTTEGQAILGAAGLANQRAAGVALGPEEQASMLGLYAQISGRTGTMGNAQAFFAGANSPERFMPIYARMVAGEELTGAGQAADVLQKGGRVSAEQSNLVLQVGAMLAGHEVGLKEAIRLLAGVVANQNAFRQDLARLQAQIQGMLAQGH
jgi:hypothetical protein